MKLTTVEHVQMLVPVLLPQQNDDDVYMYTTMSTFMYTTIHQMYLGRYRLHGGRQKRKR